MSFVKFLYNGSRYIRDYETDLNKKLLLSMKMVYFSLRLQMGSHKGFLSE